MAEHVEHRLVGQQKQRVDVLTVNKQRAGALPQPARVNLLLWDIMPQKELPAVRADVYLTVESFRNARCDSIFRVLRSIRAVGVGAMRYNQSRHGAYTFS
jgi:hypothetical protein